VGHGTVLLVEDEPMVRTVAERALTRHGYTVITANNGYEALEILDKGEEIAFSSATSSCRRWTARRWFARHARAAGLPILFMSGYAEEQLRKSIDSTRSLPAQALLRTGAGRGGPQGPYAGLMN
jgi:two-component system cell cycle sensor histidine kinase/response regulator CckA